MTTKPNFGKRSELSGMSTKKDENTPDFVPQDHFASKKSPESQ